MSRVDDPLASAGRTASPQAGLFSPRLRCLPGHPRLPPRVAYPPHANNPSTAPISRPTLHRLLRCRPPHTSSSASNSPRRISGTCPASLCKAELARWALRNLSLVHHQSSHLLGYDAVQPVATTPSVRPHHGPSSVSSSARGFYCIFSLIIRLLSHPLAFWSGPWSSSHLMIACLSPSARSRVRYVSSRLRFAYFFFLFPTTVSPLILLPSCHGRSLALVII